MSSELSLVHSTEPTVREQRQHALGPAVASGVLHLFAAVVVPSLLRDTAAVVSWRLTAWVVVQLLLVVLCIMLAAASRRVDDTRFSRLWTLEAWVHTANFAALAWVGNRLSEDLQARFMLVVIFLAIASAGTANAAAVPSRRRLIYSSLAMITASYVIAHSVAGQWLFASFTLIWLLAALLFARSNAAALERLGVLVEESRRTAQHDDLTGLLSRSAFVAELNHARQAPQDFALALADLDGFKATNDAFGHRAGDALLGEVAARLTDALPEDAVIGRLGGDEFAAIVPLADIDVDLTLRRVADRVGQPIDADGREVFVAASVGWTHIVTDIGLADLIAEADSAMYRSKNSSTSTVTQFTADMRREMAVSLDLRQQLRGAVKRGTIDFLAQPIVRATDLAPVAVELLARWRTDDGTEIDPELISTLADETGLTVELDRLALGAASRLLGRWRHDPQLSQIVVKANISPLHLNNLMLARSIRDLIPEADRDRLGLEFVESRLVAGSGPHHSLLRDFKAMGMTISMDDFGVGYSSLAYLRSLPLTEVKIDKSFVRGLDVDAINYGLVRAIVDIASTLGLSTVVEGVETHEELASVKQLGVNLIQGFLVGRPHGLAELDDRLRDALAPSRFATRASYAQGTSHA